LGPPSENPNWLLWENVLRLVFGIEEIASIKPIIAKIFIQRAVDTVGARFSNDIDSATGAAAILGFGAVDNRQLLDCIHRQDCRGRAEHAALINSWEISIPIVHVCTVDR